MDTRDPREPRYKGETDLSTLSHLRLFNSEDGIHFKDAALPSLIGKGALEAYGIEDCRVASMADGSFLLTYTATSESGYGVGLRRTVAWESYEDFGMILPPANKDCAIFESKIEEKYFVYTDQVGLDLEVTSSGWRLLPTYLIGAIMPALLDPGVECGIPPGLEPEPHPLRPNKDGLRFTTGQIIKIGIA